VKFGEIKQIPLDEGQEVQADLNPHGKLNVGRGRRRVKTTVHGGVVGVVIDARGRPLVLPEDPLERKQTLLSWFKALDLYPAEALAKIAERT
jgi:hypothetical protein